MYDVEVTDDPITIIGLLLPVGLCTASGTIVSNIWNALRAGIQAVFLKTTKRENATLAN